MGKTTRNFLGLVSLATCLAAVTILAAPEGRTQQVAQVTAAADSAAPMFFARTSSPRDTLRSYMNLMRQVEDALIKYQSEKTAENLAADWFAVFLDRRRAGLCSSYAAVCV